MNNSPDADAEAAAGSRLPSGSHPLTEQYETELTIVTEDSKDNPLHESGHLLRDTSDKICIDPETHDLEIVLRNSVEYLDEVTFEEIRSRCGVRIVNFRGRNGKTLLHEALIHRKLEVAERIFDLAAENSIPVKLSWDGGDILQLALKHESVDGVDFALKKLTSKCATVQETGRILKRHLKDLLDKYPLLVEDYLMNDRFSFEYGRFSVPSQLFNRKSPIAMTTDDQFTWTADSSDEAKDFWKKNYPALTECEEQNSESNCTAIAKFACIEDIAHRGSKKSLPSRLISSKISVDVFKSTLVSLMVDWKWNEFWKSKYTAAFVLQILNALAFLLYAANFGFEADGDKHPHWEISFLENSDEFGPTGTWNISDDNETSGTFEFSRKQMDGTAHTWNLGLGSSTELARWALSTSIVIGVASVSLRVIPPLKLLSSVIKLILWCYSIFHAEHSTLTVFLTSFECVYMSVALVWYFQAFRSTGTLASMVWYSILDARAFLVFGTVVMAGFGEAMHVLHGNKFRGDDNENFISPQRSFETLAYSVLGEFQPDVFRSDSATFLYSWRAILFNTFLFLGPVLMLTLLVSILGDTYDRVKVAEKAEQNKARARIIHVAKQMNRAIQKILPAFEERKKGVHPTNSSNSLLNFSESFREIYSGLAGEKERRKKYFHFLVPAEPVDNISDSSWHGKLNALEKMIGGAVQETEKKATRHREEVKHRLDTLVQQIVDSKTLMNSTLIKNEETLAIILNRLDQLTAVLGVNAPDHS